MQINPGGRLDIKDIVGRDDDISRYWEILARQSLILSAERRIGKTHITLKMQKQCPEQYWSFYQDLEGVHSVRELVRSIYRTVGSALSGVAKLKGRCAEWSVLLPKRIASLDLPTAQDTWQVLLTTAFEDLIAISGDKTILMIWDEFPLMVYNVQRREGENIAIELLDQLRRLRQIHADNLRFLLTGSIGLHLVLRTLQNAGNANSPVNDMYATTVPPLSDAETIELATKLLRGTHTESSTLPGLAKAVAAEVGGFPYYVHHVADQLHQLRRSIVSADIATAIETLIGAPQDPANFDYYVSRLSTYYDEPDRGRCLQVLDCIAGEEQPLTLSEIGNFVRHHDSSVTDEDVRTTVRLLVEDHYLTRRKHNEYIHYEFRWRLVRRWWKENRI